MAGMLKGKVLVTGGAGFLGRAMLRRAQAEGWPCEFTAYSRDEHKHTEVRRRFRHVRTVLGDVRDRHRLETTLRGLPGGYDLVVHAAAMKYVPEGELNVDEAVTTNVTGSRNVLRAAYRAGVPRVVGISTDKACRPVNVYGATKMLMERLFAEASEWGGTEFCCVRYGNVVGSTGSVIPLFQRQLREGGAVLVTNPRMTRFWLSVDEAIDLILHAIAARLPGGAVYVPRCGAMHMGNVARAVAGDEGRIETIGERPGEKEHEELIHFEESVRAKQEGDIFELRPAGQETGGERWTYASHSPARWIEVEEMRAMIEDVAGL